MSRVADNAPVRSNYANVQDDPNVPAITGPELQQRDTQLTALTVAVNGLGTAADHAVGDFDAAGAAATAQAAAVGSSLQKTNNLSDLPSSSTARTNLGLGSAATQPTSAFDAAGSAAAAVAAAITESVNTVAASGAAQTLPDVTTATVHRITLTANCTLTFPAAGAGKSFTVVLAQDATGSRTVTWPTVAWPGGVAPTLTTTATKRDVLSFLCADGTSWLGFISGQNL